MLLASLKQGTAGSKEGRKAHAAHPYTHTGADSRLCTLPLLHCASGVSDESLPFQIPSTLFSRILWYYCIYEYTHKYMFIQIHVCTYTYRKPHITSLSNTSLSTNALHAHTKPTQDVQHGETQTPVQTHMQRPTLPDCLPKFPSSHTRVHRRFTSDYTHALTHMHMHIHIKTQTHKPL